MEDVASKADGDEINGDTWKQAPKESQNIITDSGQALNAGDLRQLAKAVPLVVANKAKANEIAIIENGRKVHITSPDGGIFTMRTGAPVGTYNDNGGTLTGTKFTPGDGSTGFERDKAGLLLDIWFDSSPLNVAINSSRQGTTRRGDNVHSYFGDTDELDIFYNATISSLFSNVANFYLRANAADATVALQALNSAGVNRNCIICGTNGESDAAVFLAFGAAFEAQTAAGAFNILNKLQIGGVDVTVGAVDSGGAGFRVLRMPN